ncbi:DUF2889 domain-containing protein [Myxococcota bacterium]|nr:DUF2889 domain-containing protein [Myxococcota bacterium]
MNFFVEGEPIHTRCLSVGLYQADAGVVRFDAKIFDLRKAGWMPMGDGFQSAGIVHQMELAGDVSAETRCLENIRVRQPVIAYEPSSESEGESCRDPAHLVQSFVGESLNADFSGKLSSGLGGARACSHILTLFHCLVGVVTRALDLESASGFGPRRQSGERFYYRSVFVDGVCGDGDRKLQLSLNLSDVYTRPVEDVDEPMARLARHDEVRAIFGVDVKALQISEIRLGERLRGEEGTSDGIWNDRSAEVRDLLGHSMVSGVAGKCFGLFSAPADRLVLEGLLEVAPGFIQCLAALMDRTESMGLSDGSGNGRRTDLATIGGREDSCYMWRRESPLLKVREERMRGRASD